MTASVRLRHDSNSSDDEVPSKTLPIYCYHVGFEKNCYEVMKKDFSWLALHSGVQNKITTKF